MNAVAAFASRTAAVAKIHGAHLRLAARDAPTELQLWSPGPNPTDYGVHVWNGCSVREVVGRYRERGNPILIDVEHNGAQLADGEPATTAGLRATRDARGGTVARLRLVGFRTSASRE